MFRQKWRTSINRSAEAMTIFAVICAGIFPLIHMGRPWLGAQATLGTLRVITSYSIHYTKLYDARATAAHPRLQPWCPGLAKGEFFEPVVGDDSCRLRLPAQPILSK